MRCVQRSPTPGVYSVAGSRPLRLGPVSSHRALSAAAHRVIPAPGPHPSDARGDGDRRPPRQADRHSDQTRLLPGINACLQHPGHRGVPQHVRRHPRERGPRHRVPERVLDAGDRAAVLPIRSRTRSLWQLQFGINRPSPAPAGSAPCCHTRPRRVPCEYPWRSKRGQSHAALPHAQPVSAVRWAARSRLKVSATAGFVSTPWPGPGQIGIRCPPDPG